MTGIISTFEKIRSHADYIKISVGEPDTEGWLTFDELWRSSHLNDLLGRLRTRYQTTDKHFLAASLLNQSNWMFLAAAVASYYLDQRVPDLSPQNLMWRFSEEGFIEAVALRENSFYALPTDPDAEFASRVVPTMNELRQLLRADVDAHMEIVTPVLKGSSGIGKKALWGMVADRIAGMVIYLTELTSQVQLCESEVQAWIGVEGSQLRGKTGVIWLEHHGDPHPFLQRGVCCLSYKVAEYGYCSTCPLIPEEAREQRLRQHLIEHH